MDLDRRSIAARVREDMDQFTPTERKAAHVLLANYPMIGLETVAAFAMRAHVSAPTILRLISRIGFSSYPDFQKRLRAELDAQLLSPLSKTEVVAGARFDPDHFLARFRQAIVDNVTSTFADVPPAEFDAVVSLLAARQRRIYVIGGRFTDAIARYLSAHLRIVRSGVTYMIGQSDNWRDQLLDIRKKDVLVVFDIRRYQEDVGQLAAKAAARHATIVLFTDQWLSPISRHAAHVLAARIPVPSNWDSSAATLALVEALVAATTERLWPSASERIRLLEQLRTDGM